MKDYLKILKVETTDRIHLKFLDFCSEDQTKIKTFEIKRTSSARQAAVKDDHKVLKVEYLSNH
jgi:hypothetical protein